MTEDLILLHGEITEREIRKMFVIFLGAQSVAWLTARLAKTDLRIATFPPNGELRGLATTRDRSSGDVVLEVSDSDIFSSNNVLPMQPALLREATRTAAAGRLLTDDHLLPLLLLLARDAGPTDPWSSYVDALPRADCGRGASAPCCLCESLISIMSWEGRRGGLRAEPSS